MPRLASPVVSRIASAVLVALLLPGCMALPSKQTLESVRGQQNPADRTQRTITNFTPALRCMDEMMFNNGTRDVTLMMEELRDATQKVPVNARDMMTSAISDMTRRSRAVRLSVFGSDQGNLTQLLQLAQKTQPFAVLPEYNVRGSISQFDEDVRRQSASLGLLAQQAFGLRLANESRFSVLGFDAAMVRTENMTLVPGVSSKNTTVIAKRDASAGDGQGRILSASAVFSFSAARAEGTAQAARNMVELAAVELVGKLIHAPYWQCLGTADSHPEVQREIEDWFFSMGDDERIVFVKQRLRQQRWFDGALDAVRSEPFETALAAYRQALGQAAQGPVDIEFFKRFVTQAAVPGPLARSAKTALAPALVEPAANPAAPVPPALHVFVRPTAQGHAEMQVLAAISGYVYCYAQDPATQAVRRIFPNRFAKDPHVDAGATVALPGSGNFQLDATHRFACLHAPREVYGDLPAALRWGDFDDVKMAGFEPIRQAFAQASGKPVALAMAQAVAR